MKKLLTFFIISFCGTVLALTQSPEITIKKISTIAELRTTAPNSVASHSAEVLGYYTPGDGGGGRFNWDTVSTKADNGGTVIKSTSVTTGRWIRSKQSETNVLHFGADPTGIATSNVAIQAAIDAVAYDFFAAGFPPISTYTSPVIFFPPGLYRLSTGLTSYPGITLKGYPPSKTVNHTRLMMSDGIYNKSILTLQRSAPLGLVSNNVAARVDGLEFWYVAVGGTWTNAASGGAPTSVGTGSSIMISDPAVDTYITDCVFQLAPNQVRVSNTVTSNAEVYFYDCEFDSSSNILIAGSSTAVLTSRMSFDRCKFYGTRTVYSNIGVLSDSLYNSCSFEGDYCGIFATNSAPLRRLDIRNSVIRNVCVSSPNFLQASGTSNVGFCNNSVDVAVRNLINLENVNSGVISGCQFIDCGANTSITSDAVLRLNDTRNYLISGNNFWESGVFSFPAFGIFCTRSGSGTSSVYVTGNNFSLIYNGAAYSNDGVSQQRRINLSASDTYGLNCEVGTQYNAKH